MESTQTEILVTLVRIGVQLVASLYCAKMLYSYLDPQTERNQSAEKKAAELLSKLGIKTKEKLTEHEVLIASQLVLPSDLATSWSDIGGHQTTIRSLKNDVIKSVAYAKLNKNSLIKPPKGILLHGPPGCGKTLLARAVAKESGCHFINLDLSSLSSKWYGESQKIAKAVFTFAAKIQPCIVFIDEIDGFLRSRAGEDFEATAMMKAQFLQLWDGLGTDSNSTVLVMGATNMPTSVDRAVLRRLSSHYAVGMPSQPERQEVLSLLLRPARLSTCVDLCAVAACTDGWSGADLAELCRAVSLGALCDGDTGTEEDSDALAAKDFGGLEDSQEQPLLTMDLFYTAIEKMQDSATAIRMSRY